MIYLPMYLGPWCLYAAVYPFLWCYLVFLGCLHEHLNQLTKWDTSGLNLVSHLPISLALTVLLKMCSVSSAVPCQTPSHPTNPLRATAHNSSPGSHLRSHGLYHRGRGQCRPHPIHAQTTPHTMMAVEEDLVANHPEVNITMVSYHCGYMLCC